MDSMARLAKIKNVKITVTDMVDASMESANVLVDIMDLIVLKSNVPIIATTKVSVKKDNVNASNHIQV